MCSLTLALAGLSTGLQVYGQSQQTKAAVASANAQAQAAADQAAAARAQAEYQRQQAQANYQNAEIQSRKGEQISEQFLQKQQQLDARRRIAVAQNNAQMGASGIVSNVGSGLDILSGINSSWEQDSINLLGSQRNAVYDNYTQEVNYRNQGNAQTAQAFNTELNAQQYDRLSDSYVDQAKSAAKMGQIGMIGTLLGGAISMYGMAKGAGTSGGTAGSGTAQMPTAAGYRAIGTDSAFGGMSGYTPQSPKLEGPDYELVRRLSADLPIPVIGEGRVHTPQEAVQMLASGAWAVVVGGAITRPLEITGRFIKAITEYDKEGQ